MAIARFELRERLKTARLLPRKFAALTGLSRTLISRMLQGTAETPEWVIAVAELCASRDLDRALAIVAGEPEWKQIRRFPSYEVSNDGRVRRAVPGRRKFYTDDLNTLTDEDNYQRVTLYDEGGRQKVVPVHRLVADAFLHRPPPGKTMACHRNGQRQDNRDSNLYWGDASDNARDAATHRRQRLEDLARAKGVQLPVKVRRSVAKYLEGNRKSGR